jgi:hypothetical protein
MRAAFIALIGTMLSVGSALGQDDNACAVVRNLVHPDFPLPHVTAAIHAQHLDIAVVGSASSTLGGPGGPSKAYPARLEAALAERLPNVTVKVTTYIKPRESAADMVKEFDPILAEMKPALVIWQTGTADAMRGVDPEEFRDALDQGVETLRAKEADILFMNMQYSPRTESVIAIDNYEEAMRFVALQYEVLLFDRFAIMQHWSELGTFDLFAATKNRETAEHVHNCFGRLLSDVIVSAAGAVETTGKTSGKEVH